ncbi:hypothetical protein BaRGS_00017436, partial [Batillaria attramentaria]
MSRSEGVLCLFLAVLVCGFTAATRRFLMDESGDETLQEAYAAIRDLDSRLQTVMADNDRLRERLESTETALAGQSSTLSSVQRDVQNMGSRVSADFVWYDDDWMLAFRATAGIGRPVYDAWTDVGHHDDDPMTRATLPCGCTTVNGSLPCDRHYRSRLLDLWPSASIDEVRLVLYENGTEKEHLAFSGTGSDYMSWFSQERLVESSWTDLKSTTGLNYFSIAGHPSEGRRFFINHAYNSCPNDVGWLVVKDKQSETCDWGHVLHVPAILYAPSNHE